MRVVFFGTPRFALPSLQALIDQPEMEVAGVLSQPDRPSGRGRKLQPTPVKALAQQHGIPLWQPERLRRDPEVLSQLESLGADVFVVVAYGQLLPPRVLEMPGLGCVNVHGSLLPAYRGAAPIQWAVARGEVETGITTMLMDQGMDTGGMLLKTKVAISPTQTAEDLAGILAPLGADLLIKTLFLLEAGDLRPEPQVEAEASYAPLLSKIDFALDWHKPARDLHNQIRAFYPQCFTTLRGERLKVLQSQPPELTASLSASATSANTDQRPATPGTLTAIMKQTGMVVQTGQGSLLLTEVQAAGRRAQSTWDFANGIRLEVGEILSPHP
ncbi:MAG: methionyl-tRNA formyltransferase [Synechococcaceae cyanobacterium SM2_3_2]|nr:methionyl-tRNA formyltransferase [Synechococcaceae cyanobacterium SM2_3_2]